MPPTRRHRVLPAAAAAAIALALTGCATGAGAPADDAAIAPRAAASGIAADLVYTTDIDGYDLAPQSVGPGAGDGMTATWFDASTGAMVTIRTERGEMTADICAQTPLFDVVDTPVACTDDDGLWHRSAGGVEEYAAARDGAWVRVTGMNGASPSDLRAAAAVVRVPSSAELDELFSDLPDAPGEPVERGDLPENGDGAPIDPTGPGG